MAAPKLEKSGKRILGQNILSGCKLRQKQMQYILDNLSEPDFSLIECPKQIADEFNMDDREVLNGAGITWRILNTQGFGNGQHNSSTPPSYGSVHFEVQFASSPNASFGTICRYRVLEP